MSDIQQQPAPVKMALCVKNNVAELPISHWPTQLVNRAICDNQEQVDTTVLQLLPYLTIFRQGDAAQGEAPDSTFVLAYERANGSGESRLIGKSSIGFGGHIDKEIDLCILNTVAEEASRELQEELGYTVDQKLMYRSALEAIISKRLIYMNTTPVDSVHLGLSIMLNYGEEPNKVDFTAASDEVANLRWINLDDVSAEELTKFENWSSFLIQRFQQERAEEKKQQELFQERMKAAMDKIAAEQAAAQQANDDASSPDAPVAEGRPSSTVTI